MVHAGPERKRQRYGGAAAWLLAMIGSVGLLAPTPARADFDITNDWIVTLDLLPGPSSATCTWGFLQTGGTFTANGSCGSSVIGGLQGTIDVVSGAVSGSGGIENLNGGPHLSFDFTGAVAPSGSTITATVSGVVTGSLVARLCQNGNLDPGEACDDGLTNAGCCTPTCTFKPDGAECTSTLDCQTAPSCSAGACVGEPRTAGWPCEADGNACTADACDGAGACAVGDCSPCCGGLSCTPRPRAGTCKGSTDGRALIDIQSTFFGLKDKIVWNVPHVSATTLDHLPDPETTLYGVCFYVLGPADDFTVLAYDAIAPAGDGCGRARCWKTGPKGVSYNGGAQKPGGVASLRLTTGAEGKAKLSFVGKGPDLGLYHPFGLMIPGGELLVELHAGDSCWSTYFLNLGQKPSIRTTSRYRQRGDGF